MSELQPRQWAERIRQGQRFQQKFAQSDRWDRYKQYYRHKFGPKGIIPVNLYYSLLRSMVPQVYFRNPRVTVTNRRPGIEREIHARILQTLDNWMLNEVGVKEQMKCMIADSFLAGIGGGIIGYDSQYGADKTKFDITQQYSLTQFDKKGNRIEFNSQISPGMPWFLRYRPEDGVWPWGCSSSRTSEWFALRVFRQIDDLKKDKKYSNAQDLQGTSVPMRSVPEGGQVPEQDYVSTDEESKWIELWEIHDTRTGKVKAITLDSDKYLRDDEDLLQIEGLPVETISFNPDPDFIYGVPDARIIEPQQLEINEIRTQAMKHRRIDLVKMIVKKGIYTPEEIAKMTDERVQAVIEAETEGSLADTILPLNPGASGILQDLAMASEQVRGDVREMVGFSRNASGEYQGKTHISAAETQKVFQSLNIRLDERRDMMADLLSRVVKRFNQLVFTYWTQDRVAQIVGPDGAKYWMQFTGPQIKDEYDVVVTPEEGGQLDVQTKFETAIKAAEVWAQLNQGQIASGVPVPDEIQRLIFNQFQDSGLDIDRLLAQTRAANQQTQMQMAQQAAGQSAGQPASVQQLAGALQR